jgi:hypothetical protein
MLENNEPLTQAPPLIVTPANVHALCANIRALARAGVARIDYQADPDPTWDEAALALWRREHQRLVTWLVGARSAGQRLPELPAWQAIAADLARAQGPDAFATGPLSEIARRLLAAQVTAVRELCAALGRPVEARSVASPFAKAAVLAAAVTGLTACQANGPMNLRADASRDTNQTRDVGMGGGICAVQIDFDALAATDLPLSDTADAASDGSSIDGEEVDTADAYAPVGGICPAPIGGIC